MDNEKIDEIGEKLNVNSSEIEPSKSPNWFKKFSFWMINATNFVLSGLIGLNCGLTEPHFPGSGYPYAYIFIFKTALRVIGINLVNGIITILPNRKYFNINRMMRIGLVIVNFIVSFVISLVIFYSFWSIKPAPIN